MDNQLRPRTPDIRESPTTMDDNLQVEEVTTAINDLILQLPQQSRFAKTAEWIMSSVLFFPCYFPVEQERLERYADLIRMDEYSNVKNYTEMSATNEAKRSELIKWMTKAYTKYQCPLSVLFKWVRFVDVCLSLLKSHKPVDAEFICLTSFKLCINQSGTLSSQDLLNWARQDSFIPNRYCKNQLLIIENHVKGLYNLYKKIPDFYVFLMFHVENLQLPSRVLMHCTFVLECNLRNGYLVDSSLDLVTYSTLYYVLRRENSEHLGTFVANSVYKNTTLYAMASRLINFINQHQNGMCADIIEKYSTSEYLNVSIPYII